MGYRAITWKIQIVTDVNVKESDLATNFLSFEAAVQLLAPSKNPPAIGGTELMFEIPRPEQFPNMNPHFQQKTAWRYRLHGNGAYVFEIARYDKFDFGHEAPKQTRREPVTTQWGFSLWCVNWDENLAQNAALKIGEHTTWTPSLEEFLPRNIHSESTGPNPGFADYLKILERIVEVLGKAMKTDKLDVGNGVPKAEQEEDLLS